MTSFASTVFSSLSRPNYFIFVGIHQQAFILRVKLFIPIFFLLWTVNAFAQNRIKIDSLKLVLSQAETTEDRIDALFSLTDKYINNTPDTALVYALEAFDLSKVKNLSKRHAQALNRLSKIYLLKHDLKKALDYATTAHNIATENAYSEELILSIINTGSVFNTLGEYETSSAHFFNSLKLSEEINNKKLISKSLNSIGYLYYNQKNLDKALEYYLSSLSMSQSINDKNGMSAALNNVAAVYGEKGDMEQLKSYVLQASKINKEIDQLHYLAINYLNLGVYYYRKEQNDSSIYYNQAALAIAREMNNISLESQIKSNIVLFKFWTGNTDESLEEAKEVLAEAQEHKIKKTIYSMAELIDRIYISRNDYKSAYPYSSLKFELKDSLNLDDEITETSKTELLYEISKNEQKQKIAQQRRDYIFIIIGLVLLSLLGSLWLLLKRNKMKTKITELEKLKLEDQLEYKNKELTTNVISLLDKNETLGDFSIKLMEIEKEAVKDETKQAIKKISKELKRIIGTGVWEEFELRFKEVHTDFYNNLIKEYPNLSPNELRLSAFLRLNMSTKEISQLTGQSVNAIEMARFRLRKKLNISNTDENLIAFLSQI